MAKIGTWSTTPGNNNATPPDGWPEGQAPSTVNNCAREMMAAIRTAVDNLEYVDLGNTPSFLTATTFSMATADVVNFEVGRRVKLYDSSTLYGTIISVSSTEVAVRLDTGALTSSLSSVAMAIVRESNNSLPISVWKQDSILINGHLDVWQRGGSFSFASGGGYTADRMEFRISGAAACNITRFERSANASAVPTLAQAGTIFNNSLLISVSAADAVMAADEFCLMKYYIEGYDWRQIAHKPFNFTFWANTNRSGIYAAVFRAGGLSFVQNFTVASVSSWQCFSLPISAPPATATNNYSSGIGMSVALTFASGATRQGGGGNWTATDIIATASQVNFLASAGNTFAVTGLALHEGTALLPYEIRPFQQELAKCRRYYQTVEGDLLGFAVGSQQGAYLTNFPVMRTTPTVAYPNVTNLTVFAIGTGFIAVSAVTASNVTNSTLLLSAVSTFSGFTGGLGSLLRIASGAPITLDAEF